MFEFLKRHKVEAKDHSDADEIRKYAKVKFVTPARQKGEKTISFSASDIHKGLGYNLRMPAVCSAIDAQKFADFARVRLVKRSGPHQGAAAKWTFEI
jgi:5-methylcytosine-specific restriction protein B